MHFSVDEVSDLTELALLQSFAGLQTQGPDSTAFLSQHHIVSLQETHQWKRLAFDVCARQC